MQLLKLLMQLLENTNKIFVRFTLVSGETNWNSRNIGGGPDLLAFHISEIKYEFFSNINFPASWVDFPLKIGPPPLLKRENFMTSNQRLVGC